MRCARLLMKRLPRTAIPASSNIFTSLEKGFGIQNHARADEADLAVMQDSRRDQMQDELLSLHNDGVACVMPTLVTGDDVELFSQQIDNLPFAFIAPLGADNHDVCHDVSLAFSLEHSAFLAVSGFEFELDASCHIQSRRPLRKQGLRYPNLNEADCCES